MKPIEEAAKQLRCSKPHIYNEAKKLPGLLHTDRGKTYVNLKVWFSGDSDTNTVTSKEKSPSIEINGLSGGLTRTTTRLRLFTPFNPIEVIRAIKQLSDSEVYDLRRYLMSPIVSPTTTEQSTCLRSKSSFGGKKEPGLLIPSTSATTMPEGESGSPQESPVCRTPLWRPTRTRLLAERSQATQRTTDRSEPKSSKS